MNTTTSRRSSCIDELEVKAERMLSLSSEHGTLSSDARPSLLRRSTTLSGYPRKDQDEAKILEKTDPRLFKDLPELPNDLASGEDAVEEQILMTKEEETVKSNLQRRPRLRKVLSSPNRLSLLRPAPLKLQRFPEWLGGGSRSPSSKSVSPMSSASINTESSNEAKDVEEKVGLKQKKSFKLLSPSDWLKSPSRVIFRDRPSDSCAALEERRQAEETDPDTFSLAEELDLIQSESESPRSSFHSTKESILGSIAGLNKHETENTKSQETQWSQESGRESELIEAEGEDAQTSFIEDIYKTKTTSGSEETLDHDHRQNKDGRNEIVEFNEAEESAEVEKIEEAWTAFNVSPGVNEMEKKLINDQNAFPVTVDTLTSYDRSRATPDVGEDHIHLKLRTPLLLNPISERTVSTFTEPQFFSANSSMTELDDLSKNVAPGQSEESDANEIKKVSRKIGDADEPPRSSIFSVNSHISSLESPLKNTSSLTSIPSTPTSFTSTALSSPIAQTKRFSPSNLSEFITHSHWSDDSDEEEDTSRAKEKRLRNKKKFKSTFSGLKDENPRNSQMGKRLGLIFDHPFHPISHTNPNRKSIGTKKKSADGGESPQFDLEASFLDINTVHSPIRMPSKLLMGLTYVPHLLRHRCSTINFDEQTSSVTEMQRSKSTNDLASSYRKKKRNSEKISTVRSNTLSPTQSQDSEPEPETSPPRKSVASYADQPFLLSSISPQLSPTSPKLNRLSHKPSLPVLLEGRMLTNESNGKRLNSSVTLDQGMNRLNQQAQRSSWHPYSFVPHSSQFRDDIIPTQVK